MPEKTERSRKNRQSLQISPDISVREALKRMEAAGARSGIVCEDNVVLGHLAGRTVRPPIPPEIPGQPATALESELRLARKIQQQLLPRAIPNIPGLDVFGALVSARDVGGDYWSAKYYRGDGRVTLKLADVTGHGIAAALLVPAVKYISGGFYRGAPSPEWVIGRTNHVLVKETPVEILVSMVYGWYNVRTQQLQVVNAGHRPAFIIQGDEIVDVPITGPVMGLLETDYHSTRFGLKPGDVYFACSDGLVEARRGKEQFGEERVKAFVFANRHLPANQITVRLLAECDAFNNAPEDDRSVLVAIRRP